MSKQAKLDAEKHAAVPLNDDVFDTDLRRKLLTDDEEETTGGLGGFVRQRKQARPPAASVTATPTHRTSEEDDTSGGLAAMGITALAAGYAAYAAAYAMKVEQGKQAQGLLQKLSWIRTELQKRCIIDVLLPLLAHINPFVQVTAAIDILCSLFEHSDRAIQVLRVARGGGRGAASFLAGFALDTYFHAQLTPLPSKMLDEAGRLYTNIPKAIQSYRETVQTHTFPAPEKIVSWDGNEHTGTFLAIPLENGSRYYAQHIGMNEYQVYHADRLTEPPHTGELYHVRRDGFIQEVSDRGRSVQARSKL